MGVTVQIVRSHRRPKGCLVNEDRRTLELRVTYNRVPRYYVTNGTVRLTEEEYRNANLKIHKEAFEEVRADYNAALDIVRKLDEHFSFDSFACDYKRLVRKEITNVYDVQSIFSEYISDTSRSLPISYKTKITYDTTLNWLVKFKKHMTIDQITPESVSKFVSFLRKSNPDISRNTINIYLRCLRAVYNFAVDRGYIDDRKPFRKLSLSSSRKMNYGLSSKSLQQIFEYDSKDDLAQFGRDMGHTNSTTTQGYINSLRINSMKKSKMIKELLHEGVSMTS